MQKDELRILFKSNFFCWILFACCPILAMPFVIEGAYKNKINSYILFAIFMGLCSMLIIFPFGDLYRHALTYYELGMYDWNDFKLYLEFNFKIDFLLQLIDYFFIHNEIPFGYIRFFLVSISYFLHFKLYDLFCRQYTISNSEKKIVFWFLILIVPFSAISIGIRFGFAIVLFSYFVCKRYWFNHKSAFDFTYIIVAVFFHFATIIFLTLLLLFKIGIYIKNKKTFLLIFFLLFILSNSLGGVLYILPIDERLAEYLLNYTEGSFADTSYLAGLNIFGLLPLILNYILNIFLMFLFYKYIPINRKSSLIYNTFLLFAATSAFFSLNGRIATVFYLYAVVYLLKEISIQKMKILFFVYLLGVIISVSLTWRRYSINKWTYLFTPVLVSFQQDYDLNWIYQHIDSTGSPYIYLY